MTKLIAAVGGVLLIGATLVLLCAALVSGQLASYSGGICVQGTTTVARRIPPTTPALSAGGASCYPASGKSSNVAMAALSIAAHLSGNPDTRYDAGMPQQVLQFWATACPISSGCWADWQQGSLQCVPLVTASYAPSGPPLPAAC